MAQPGRSNGDVQGLATAVMLEWCRNQNLTRTASTLLDEGREALDKAHAYDRRDLPSLLDLVAAALRGGSGSDLGPRLSKRARAGRAVSASPEPRWQQATPPASDDDGHNRRDDRRDDGQDSGADYGPCDQDDNHNGLYDDDDRDDFAAFLVDDEGLLFGSRRNDDRGDGRCPARCSGGGGTGGGTTTSSPHDHGGDPQDRSRCTAGCDGQGCGTASHGSGRDQRIGPHCGDGHMGDTPCPSTCPNSAVQERPSYITAPDGSVHHECPSTARFVEGPLPLDSQKPNRHTPFSHASLGHTSLSHTSLGHHMLPHTAASSPGMAHPGFASSGAPQPVYGWAADSSSVPAQRDGCTAGGALHASVPRQYDGCTPMGAPTAAAAAGTDHLLASAGGIEPRLPPAKQKAHNGSAIFEMPETPLPGHRSGASGAMPRSSNDARVTTAALHCASCATALPQPSPSPSNISTGLGVTAAANVMPDGTHDDCGPVNPAPCSSEPAENVTVAHPQRRGSPAVGLEVQHGSPAVGREGPTGSLGVGCNSGGGADGDGAASGPRPERPACEEGETLSEGGAARPPAAGSVAALGKPPLPPGPTLTHREEMMLTRDLQTKQVIDQETFRQVILQPGAAERDIGELFLIRMRTRGLNNRKRPSEKLSNLGERQDDAMRALAGCSDVRYAVANVSLEVRESMQAVYDIDKVALRIWFKNRGRNPLKPKDDASAPKQRRRSSSLPATAGASPAGAGTTPDQGGAAEEQPNAPRARTSCDAVRRDVPLPHPLSLLYCQSIPSTPCDGWDSSDQEQGPPADLHVPSSAVHPHHAHHSYRIGQAVQQVGQQAGQQAVHLLPTCAASSPAAPSPSSFFGQAAWAMSRRPSPGAAMGGTGGGTAVGGSSTVLDSVQLATHQLQQQLAAQQLLQQQQQQQQYQQLQALQYAASASAALLLQRPSPTTPDLYSLATSAQQVAGHLHVASSSSAVPPMGLEGQQAASDSHAAAVAAAAAAVSSHLMGQCAPQALTLQQQRQRLLEQQLQPPQLQQLSPFQACSEQYQQQLQQQQQQRMMLEQQQRVALAALAVEQQQQQQRLVFEQQQRAAIEQQQQRAAIEQQQQRAAMEQQRHVNHIPSFDQLLAPQPVPPPLPSAGVSLMSTYPHDALQYQQYAAAAAAAAAPSHHTSLPDLRLIHPSLLPMHGTATVHQPSLHHAMSLQPDGGHPIMSGMHGGCSVPWTPAMPMGMPSVSSMSQMHML